MTDKSSYYEAYQFINPYTLIYDLDNKLVIQLVSSLDGWLVKVVKPFLIPN